MNRSILNQIRKAIRLNQEDNACQTIKSHGLFLSRRDLSSLINYMNKIKTYSISVIRYIYFTSPFRHDVGEVVGYHCAMDLASGAGYSDVVGLMLNNLEDQRDLQNKCPAFFVEWYNFHLDMAARNIAHNGDAWSIKHLLGCMNRISNNISVQCSILNQVLNSACAKGYTDIVTLVINKYGDHFKQDPGNRAFSEAIDFACSNGHRAIVSILLEHTNPGANQGIAIRHACLAGHLDVVRLLLEDPRTDPACNDNISIGNAIMSGNTSVVKLLLEDERVNLADPRNFIQPIHVASTFEVVQLLLADGRTDPSTQNNRALFNIMTRLYDDNDEQIRIIKLLLSDRRVIMTGLDVAIEMTKYKPHLTSLLTNAMAQRNIEN